MLFIEIIQANHQRVTFLTGLYDRAVSINIGINMASSEHVTPPTRGMYWPYSSNVGQPK